MNRSGSCLTGCNLFQEVHTRHIFRLFLVSGLEYPDQALDQGLGRDRDLVSGLGLE